MSGPQIKSEFQLIFGSDIYVRFHFPSLIYTQNGTFQLHTFPNNQHTNFENGNKKITLAEMMFIGESYKNNLVGNLKLIDSPGRLDASLGVCCNEAINKPYLDIYFFLYRRCENTPYEILHEALSQRSRISHALSYITHELYLPEKCGAVHHKIYSHISEIKLDKLSYLSGEEKNKILREFTNTYFI